jgi:acyl-CoA reductase-like NAD-dependent aldehyde dehydrogenase
MLSTVTLAEGAQDEIAVRAPFTGDLLAAIPAGTARDVEYAVTLARNAQSAWAARSFSDRGAIFLRFHDLLLQRQDEILDLIQLETGKARRHAFEEVLDTAVVCRYYAFHAQRFLRPRRRRGALPFFTRTQELRTPVGVVGFIVPWNYPLNLAITDAAAALMAGNTAVLKPDAQTSLTALWAVNLLREAGLPADAFLVVTGDGAVVGPAVGERVDFLMFTGGGRTGRLVAHQAAERLIGCSLELGGKNPMLVLADADLSKAVDGAVRACFSSAGQICVSIERMWIHQSIWESFVGSFVARTKVLRLGSALDYSIEMGCLASERQMRTVEEHVGDALAQGAKLLVGGRRRSELGPLFYEPTILTDVRPGMKLYAEETFGPVISLYAYDDVEDAIRQANATRYGLSASIWTRDVRRGVELARKLHVGSVNVNEAYAATWGSVDSPIGGVKESGLRGRHGAEGIVKFTESQTIAVQRLLPVAPLPGLDPGRYARWMTRSLALIRKTRILG